MVLNVVSMLASFQREIEIIGITVFIFIGCEVWVELL